MHTDALALAVVLNLCVGFVTVLRLLDQATSRRWQETLPYLRWLAEMDRAERAGRALPHRRPVPPSTPSLGRGAGRPGLGGMQRAPRLHPAETYRNPPAMSDTLCPCGTDRWSG